MSALTPIGLEKPSRRELLAGGLAAAFAGSSAAAEPAIPVRIRIANAGPVRPISPYVYGSNEIGHMDGPPSAPLDRAAGVRLRRLGGNLMTSYNWTTNFSNGGKDDQQANRTHWPDILDLTGPQRLAPGAVIETMHRSSLAMGAASLVTLPLAGFVAADAAGIVAPGDAAPSRRFVPVVWASEARATDPVDPSVADIPHLLRRLVARFGPANSSSGIRFYALDNEPGIWFQNHPRIVPQRVTIADFLTRSIAAARAIKAIDPTAAVLGPVSWGPTEMATFQDAPDWPAFRSHGSFLAAYLAAFRTASDRAGLRLLDMLDIHWYAFSNQGQVFRSEDPRLARVMLDAPRSLSERGFREDSWVARALPVSDDAHLALPILPSLQRLAATHFPGTEVAVTEFNYGGAGQLAAGLAVADALGRFGAASIGLAAHWGSLDGWLNQAYRLFCDYDGHGGRYGEGALTVELDQPSRLSAFAARSGGRNAMMHLIVINKAERETFAEVTLQTAPPAAEGRTYGFDAGQSLTGPIAETAMFEGTQARLRLPARSARHIVFG